MKKQTAYASPSISVMEVSLESGIAQSAGIAPGTTGSVEYNADNDHYEF